MSQRKSSPWWTAVCALAPVSQAFACDVQSLLARHGRGFSTGRTPLGRALAALEMALSVVLIVSAVLVGRTFMNLRRVDVGFSADRVLAFLTNAIQATRGGTQLPTLIPSLTAAA